MHVTQRERKGDGVSKRKREPVHVHASERAIVMSISILLGVSSMLA